MELVAMDMKLRGMYIARQLSFKGVGFKIEQVPISKEFVKVYNEAVKLVSSSFSEQYSHVPTYRLLNLLNAIWSIK